MKKPKVTENYSGEYAYVCVGNRILGKDGVSEMIDALIEVRKNMISLKKELYDDGYRGSAFLLSKDISTINEALKKVGCIDENR